MKCPNCNESDHEPGAKFCHNCGSVLNPEAFEASKELMAHGKTVLEAWERMRRRQAAEEDSSSRSWWKKTLRLLMLIAVLIEYIIISIIESNLGTWGWITIIYMNGIIILMTIFLYAFTDKSFLDNREKKWRIYYEWLHFIAAAFVAPLGLFVCNFQNLWTLIFESLLVGIMLLADFGTLEEIIEM